MSALPSTPGCIIYASPVEVRNKLAQMGVPLALLIEAAQQGFVERSNATRFDPVTKAGTDAWSYPVRVVRAGLEKLGWRLDDPMNLPLVISDQRRLNITVSSGDEMTGIAHGQRVPKSKNPKGALHEAAIDRNLGQRDMFPDSLPTAIREYEKTVGYPTWVYLVHVTDETIQAELSLPNSMDADDRLDGWSERIIINVPLPGSELVRDEGRDDGPDIVPRVASKI